MIYFLLGVIILFFAISVFLSVIIIRLYRFHHINSIRLESCYTWLTNLIDNKRSSIFFDANNIKSIGFLGYNSMTFLIMEELGNSNVQVVFCIEKKGGLEQDLRIVNIGLEEIDEYIEKVDIIIDSFPEEKNKYDTERTYLKKQNKVKFVSIHDIINYTSEL